KCPCGPILIDCPQFCNSTLQVTWEFYQDLIGAYGHPDRFRGKKLMTRVIHTLCKGLPEGLEELAQLGRTLWRRRADILAYFNFGATAPLSG
uniref:transposase n=1 Tax=Corynebacterium variabile TaxID=1727 RepID=UPI0028A5A67E